MHISFSDTSNLSDIYGPHNAHLKLLEEALGINIQAKSNELTLKGPKNSLKQARNILNTLKESVAKGHSFVVEDIKNMIHHVKEDIPMSNITDTEIQVNGDPIRPRNPRQADYINAIRANNITFGIGPAGTGKTYLAVAMAVEAYLKGDIKRMIFCRPAVEAGESLGFLPGDMQEKVAPYLRPIHDALFDMMPPGNIEKARQKGEIEIAPLAFMRGRSLNHSAIVLDEAQNTTPQQMKMFLTRYGRGAKMIVCGDPSQVDIKDGHKNGLSDALAHLSDVPHTAFVKFSNKDVVRDEMVSHILHAYDNAHRD